MTVHDLLAPTTAFADLSAEIADIRWAPKRKYGCIVVHGLRKHPEGQPCVAAA